jgi:IS5 family transposase
MSRWRKRIGPEAMDRVLKATVEMALASGTVKPSSLERVTVDTTVQEKAIAHPTDSRLYLKALQALVRQAKKAGVELRQSHTRLAKKASVKAGRYAHAKQYRRMRRELKRLRTYLGRVYRDVGRKIAGDGEQQARFARLLGLVERLLAQQPKDKNKLYSLHAPEVECISKGKAHRKYEFGCKVSVATTSKDNWIVGVEALHDNPFDGHTLKGALQQIKRLAGWEAQNVYCDKGYKGNPKQLGNTAVHLASKRKSSMPPSEWRWFKRRSAIEPVIGHMKQDNRMDRNYLKGTDGDKMNAILAACGFNLRKLLRAILWFLFKELERLKVLLRPFTWPPWAARELTTSPGLNVKLQSSFA